MREFRILRKVSVFIAIIGFVVFFSHGYYLDYQADKKFLNEKYEGIVMDLRYIKGKRGFPDVKINNKWIYLGVSSKISFKVQIGDSLVKKMGQTEIEVYRRDLAGEWVKLVFD